MNTAIIGWSMARLRNWCELMGIPKSRYMTGPDAPTDRIILLPVGAATCGTPLDKVILVGFKPGDGATPILADHGLEWYNCCVRTKRPVGHVDDVVYIPTVYVCNDFEHLKDHTTGETQT